MDTQRSEGIVGGNRYLCQPTREIGGNWLDLASLRLQVKHLKSVYLVHAPKLPDVGDISQQG